jgi:glycosyltransferase involved in cell wall biosynthesis
MTEKRIWGTLDPFVESGAFMGRKVANAGFFQALIGSQAFDEYHFFLPDNATILNIKKKFENWLPDPQATVRFFLRRQLPRQLRKTPYHCFHLSDCINWPASLASLRNRHSRQLFPITSLTHSLSLTRYVREMLVQIWAGTTPRDCIVSSSAAGKTVVENIFAQARGYLGLSVQDALQPDCRIIPLGIDAAGFAPPDREDRLQARQHWSVGEKETVLLVFGRISPHSKMDVLPLLRALQRVVSRGIRREDLRLLIGGWVEPGDEFPETLKTLARNMKLRMDLVPSPGEAMKRRLFAAADIFVSLADNPQETFGLSLLEAGSMGLPVIASDFNGYRDIVVHAKTGFLVPTLGNPHTEFVDELAPLISDYHSHLWLSQGTVVDVPELAEDLLRLIRDEGVRRAMGEAARDRVVSRFSWERIIAEYVALWDELWTVPLDRDRFQASHPLNMAYGTVFGNYCTANISGSTRLVWTRCGQAVYREQDFFLIYAGLEDWITPEIIRLLVFHSRNIVSMAKLTQALKSSFPDLTEARLHLVVMWALKQDLIKMVDNEESDRGAQNVS